MEKSPKKEGKKQKKNQNSRKVKITEDNKRWKRVFFLGKHPQKSADGQSQAIAE